jgi:hypothetical protein
MTKKTKGVEMSEEQQLRQAAYLGSFGRGKRSHQRAGRCGGFGG